MQFLLPKHVSGTNISIVRSTISEYLLLLGGHTWKAAWVVLQWASWGEHRSAAVAQPRRLSRYDHLKAEDTH
jgi:hypothetical protein